MDDNPPAERQYYLCTHCGEVMGPRAQPSGDCRRCKRGDFTEIILPVPPGRQAIALDTRDVEAAIRQAYEGLAFQRGDGVLLADLRDALPADLDRDTVDAALTKLAAHSGVFLAAGTDQQHADPRTQESALAIGGRYEHVLRIDDRQRSLATSLQRIRSTSQVRAESMLAPLSDTDVAYLAERMDVDVDGGPAEVRCAVAERAPTTTENGGPTPARVRPTGLCCSGPIPNPTGWRPGRRTTGGALPRPRPGCSAVRPPSRVGRTFGRVPTGGPATRPPHSEPLRSWPASYRSSPEKRAFGSSWTSRSYFAQIS